MLLCNIIKFLYIILFGFIFLASLKLFMAYTRGPYSTAVHESEVSACGMLRKFRDRYYYENSVII